MSPRPTDRRFQTRVAVEKSSFSCKMFGLLAAQREESSIQNAASPFNHASRKAALTVSVAGTYRDAFLRASFLCVKNCSGWSLIGCGSHTLTICWKRGRKCQRTPPSPVLHSVASVVIKHSLHCVCG